MTRMRKAGCLMAAWIAVTLRPMGDGIALHAVIASAFNKIRHARH